MLTELNSEQIFSLNRSKSKWPELIGLDFKAVLFALRMERPFYEVEKVSFEEREEFVQPSSTRIRVFLGRNGKVWRIHLG
jgi:hypothetical protein